jgi:GNAT superfamily N-acetyltransferase
LELVDRGPARGRPAAWLVMLTDGAEVSVRPARPDDAMSLQATHARCSPETRYLRYFASAAQLPATLLPVLLGRAPGTVALVAETRERRLVGLANLITNADATGEVALLVEDCWQRRGLGTALVRRLVAIARDCDLHALTAVTLRCNGRPARVLARAGLSVEVHVADDLLHLRASLAPTPAAQRAPTPGWACLPPARVAPTDNGPRWDHHLPSIGMAPTAVRPAPPQVVPGLPDDPMPTEDPGGEPDERP